MNVGLLLPNWIGDAVMATPALRALREHLGPAARLVGIVRPPVAEVLAGNPWLSETVLSDPGRGAKLGRVWRLAQSLRQARVETLLLLTNSFSTALAARLSGTRQRIGFGGGGRGWLLSRPLVWPKENGKPRVRSAVDHYLQLAAALGASDEPGPVELRTTPWETAAAEQAFQSLGIAPHERVIALSTGGAFGPAKRWPTEHFALLARRIVDALPARVLVLCGPDERAAAGDIVRLAGDARVVSLADLPLSLRLSKGCLARAELFVGTDSGPRHIAAALGVPTIALFGPTDPRWSVNYAPGAVELAEKVPCGPCGQRVCPLGHHRCLVDLSVDRVFAAVMATWPTAARGAA